MTVANCKRSQKHWVLAAALFFFAVPFATAGETTVAVDGDKILLNGKPTKILGLRCSNALISDESTNALIRSLDIYQSYGINTVSVFVMGSRFGDVKGYQPDGSLSPLYLGRLEKVLRATDERKIITIVGCLYWSTSKAKEDLGHWDQKAANQAIANTAKWLADKDFRHVILDPDNEGMAVRAKKWKCEQFILAAKQANPQLVVANNTRQLTTSEDLNMHFGKPEPGKPWFDSEATPDNTPGGYWGKFSKVTHQKDTSYYNYSRIGRYTEEMKRSQLQRTDDEIRDYNGHVLASTWLQCGPDAGVNGPFTDPGGRSNLGSQKDPRAAWNQDVDSVHPDAGILWWLEHIKEHHTNE